MADNIQATPRNELLGLLADAMYGGLDWMKDPRRTQQMRGLAGLLESTGIPKTTERMAYGEPLTNIGRANVPLLKPETAEAMMTVAPIVGPAARTAQRAAMSAGRAGERLAERVVPQVMERGGIGAGLLGDLSRGSVSPLDVYHGTPHTLPPTPRNPLGEFDASKIGTGEGAQSFGYGIYTAENPAVAKEYQFMQQNWFDTSKAKYKGKSIDSWYEQAQKDQERAFRTKDKTLEKDATARLAYWENIMTHNHPENVLQQFSDPNYGWDAATNYAKSIDLSKFTGIPRTGNLYKVDLPDEKIATMLDWDKPLSQQSPQVQAALKGIEKDLPSIPDFDLKKWMDADPLASTWHNVLARDLQVEPSKISELLQSKGVAGIRYLDEGSRSTTGKKTSNFVVFPNEEKSMTILERNGVRAFPEQSPYPQQAALNLAQKRAALPVEQGGLGLPANNTAADRAKAMGFNVNNPLYHATDVDFASIRPSLQGKLGAGVYVSPSSQYAEKYTSLNAAGNARVLPLVARGNLADDDVAMNIAESIRQEMAAQNPNFSVAEWKKRTTQALADAGYAGRNMSGLESVITDPSNVRSRFAAFDPFRKDVATATAMGVALPDLLAAEPTPEELQRRQSSSLLFP